MKIKVILITCIITMVMVGCSDRPADHYDKNNYIGAADVDKYLARYEGVKRSEMSAFEIDGNKAYMNGYISSDTIRQVKKLIEKYPDVKTIVMQDVGGSVDDVSNLEASRLVRNASLNTYIAKDGFIASGGTDFFIAGKIRIAQKGAQVGVHSWSGDGIENANELSRDDENHTKYIKYYEEMKMKKASEFYFFTIKAAPTDGMYYMTADELLKYGVVTEIVK